MAPVSGLYTLDPLSGQYARDFVRSLRVHTCTFMYIYLCLSDSKTSTRFDLWIHEGEEGVRGTGRGALATFAESPAMLPRGCSVQGPVQDPHTYFNKAARRWYRYIGRGYSNSVRGGEGHDVRF